MAGTQESLHAESTLRPPVEEKFGLLTDLWRSKTWRLFPLLTTYVVSLTLLTPVKPNLMTDFFASRHSRHYIHCEAYLPALEPQACRDAHSSVVTYSSFSDFVSNSFLLFLLAPLIGKWSDCYGRQPFLVLTFVCASFPVLVLFFNLNYGLSMYFYFPAQALNGALSSMSICMAYVADVLHPDHRAPTFGLILCSFSVGILVGPLGGGYINPRVASIAALSGLLSCVLYVIFLIPESTTKESRLLAQKKQKAEQRSCRGPWQGFSILGRSSLFARLTAVLMISSVVAEGMYELLMQYFQIKLNFGTQDQAHMFVLAGLCGMFTQLVILRLLLRFVGKSRMLLFGLAASFAQQTLLVFARNKAMGLFAVCLGSVGNLAFPAISSIKSLHVSQTEQGAMQGALQGAKALAQGLGPLIFAGLFSLFTKSWSPLPYIPGAPFACGAVLLFIAFLVAATINRQEADGGRHHEASGDLEESLLFSDEGELHQHKPAIPPGLLLQHAEGPAMLLDQTPDFAIDVLPMIPEQISAAGVSEGPSSSSNE